VQHGRALPQEGPAGRFAALVEQGLGSDLATAVCQLEKDLIELGLRETRGNKSRLAARLGVSRTTLIKKIREYGLDQTDPGRTNPGIDE
jgi:DNA-binding NtrC family response regulator